MMIEEEEDVDTCAYCLLLPGKILNLSYLLRLKKFRKKGNKDGAVTAFYQLQEAELGRVIEIGGSSGAATVSTISAV